MKIGSTLGKKGGLRVIHDDTVKHDYPSYPQSYVRSSKTLEENLKENPIIKKLYLDIHRERAPKGWMVFPNFTAMGDDQQ